MLLDQREMEMVQNQLGIVAVELMMVPMNLLKEYLMVDKDYPMYLHVDFYLMSKRKHLMEFVVDTL
jgi:hypothetical protein